MIASGSSSQAKLARHSPVPASCPPGSAVSRRRCPSASTVSTGRPSRRPSSPLQRPTTSSRPGSLQPKRSSSNATSPTSGISPPLASGRRPPRRRPVSVVSCRWSSTATRSRTSRPSTEIANEIRPTLSTAPASITSAAANASHAPRRAPRRRRRAAGRSARRPRARRWRRRSPAATGGRRRSRSGTSCPAATISAATARPASSTSTTSNASQALSGPYQSRNRLTSSRIAPSATRMGPTSNLRVIQLSPLQWSGRKASQAHPSDGATGTHSHRSDRNPAVRPDADLTRLPAPDDGGVKS